MKASAMSSSLFDMIPVRPELLQFMTPQSWGIVEMSMAFLVIVMTFVQKTYDHSQSTSGIVGGLSYVALVWKAGFSFWIIWDGAYIFAHAGSEHPRPLLCLAMFTLALQQFRQMIFHWASTVTVRRSHYAHDWLTRILW